MESEEHHLTSTLPYVEVAFGDFFVTSPRLTFCSSSIVFVGFV